MSAERRISISRLLVLSRRAGSRRKRASLREPLWLCRYGPWLAAALTLVGLIVAAIAMLEILTPTPQPPRPLAPSRQHERAEELGPEVETIGTLR